jgi:ABC-type amino acid transport substrate-binding protein/CheY-like chemotaxis protein
MIRSIFLLFFLIITLNASNIKEVFIAYNVGNPPLKFQNDKGEPDGVLIDIWKLWSKKTGVELHFKEAPFSSTVDMIKNSKADIHAGLFYTKQRDEFLDYSDKSIFDIKYYIFHHKNILKIESKNDLKSYIIGVPEGYTHQYMEENFKGVTLRVYKNFPELFDSVQKGEIKIFVSPVMNFEHYLQKHNLENNWYYSSSKPLYKRSYYAAVKEGNSELLKLLNKGFSEVSYTDSIAIEKKWIKKSLKNKGEIESYIISCDGDYAPFSFINTKGNAAGILVDFWKLWAKKEGVQVKFLFNNWNESIQAVQDGLADFHSGFKNDKQWATSTNPFLQVKAKLYYPVNGVKKNIQEFFGKTIATISPYYQKIIQKKFPKIKAILVTDYSDYFNKIASKEISGFIDDEQAIETLLLKQGRTHEFISLDDFFFTSKVSAILKKGDNQLISKIDKGLQKISVEEKYKIYDKWLKKPESLLLNKELEQWNQEQIPPKKLQLHLTHKEKAWLKKHPAIKLAFRDGWSTDDEGNSIHSDLLKLLNKYSGLNFIPAMFSSWQEAFNNGAKGDNVYGVMSLSWSKQREEKYFYYTEPYNFTPTYLIVRQGNNNIHSLEDLKNQTIYLNEKEITHQTIKDLNFPVKVIDVKNDQEMIRKLFQSKEVQVGLTFAADQNILQKYDLKVVERIYDKYADVSIGVSYKHKELQSIINKIYKIIPQEEIVELRSKIYQKSSDKKEFKNNKKYQQFIKAKLDRLFTDEEKKWLKTLPWIKIAFVREWASDDYGNNIHTEILRLLNKYSDIDFLPVKYDTWKESFDEASKGINVHGMMYLSWSEEREKKYFYYTEPYNFMPCYLIVRKGNKDIHSLEDLKDKTVYLKQNVITHQIIKELPFNVNTIDLVDDDEMLQKLSKSKEAQAMLSYTIAKRKLDQYGLKIVKNIYNKYSNIAIGVSHQYKILQSIIDKIYSVIPKEEMNKLHSKNYEKTKKVKLLDNLTIAEKQWLEKHQTIRVSNEVDWAPFDYFEQGISKGISVDMINEIFKMIGVKAEFISGTWAEVLEKFKNKQIDLIHPIVRSKERENYTFFTKPHMQLNNVLIVRSNEDHIKTLHDLFGKKLAVAKGWANHELLQKNYPEINFVEVSGTTEGLEAVARNKVDAYTDTLLSAEYMIKKNFMANLKIVNKSASIKELGYMRVHLGVRSDWPIFYSIIKKALDLISPNEIEKIYTKYGFSFKEKVPTIFLSKEEAGWIEKNNFKVRVCIDPDWMPFEKLNENGKYIGIGAEYMSIFEKKLGYPIELVKTKNWGETLEMIKRGECDILPLAMSTPQRKEYLNFTTPYLSFPTVIATNKDKVYIEKIEDVLNKKLGTTKDYATFEILKTEYPNINLIEVENIHEGLRKVDRGELYGFIDPIASIIYEIQNSRLLNLKISGNTGWNFDLSVAVRKDAPELLHIFQKLVDSIDEEDTAKINSKWLSIKYEQGFDYTLLWKILGIVALIIIAFLYWTRKLAIEANLRKKAEEEAKQANKAKSLFLARMSHEIRTPMNAILGMLYLVQKTELTPIQKNYIKKSKNAAESLLHLINDILDFSKIEAEKMDVQSVEFDFTELITVVSGIMSIKAEQKGIELLVEYDPLIPKYLVGDPTRIQQILINLIGNSIKFTADGEVVLSIQIKEQQSDTILLIFSIMDTGIGILQNDQDKLFQEFSQVDGSITRKFGGTGLGLAISKKLARLMGGEMWLENSEKDKGAIFCFTIECGVSHKNSNEKKTFPDSLKDLKILVVDDNKIAAGMLRYTLESLHLKSDAVNSADEVIDLICNQGIEYDLILMDYKMPRLNGIEIYKELEEKHKNKLPKIVMVLGYSDENIIEASKNIGIDTFVTKPVSPSVLFDIIIQLVDKDRVTLPLKSDIYKDQETSIESIAGSNILLVEDNVINQEFATILLSDNDLKVDIANDGLEVLKMIQEKKYDCILMDIQMPNMDGIEATKRIRAMGKGDSYFKEVPIIAMTAHAMSGDMEKSLEAGMNDHITKPIDPNKLFKALLKFIKPTQISNKVLKKQKKEVLHFFDTFEDNELINFKDALKRLGGDEKSLLNILKSFALKYKDVDKTIQTFIENKDFKAAEAKVHEIKGVSGNISADNLYKLCIELDNVLKKEHEPHQTLMKMFRYALDKVINFITTLQNEQKIDQKAFDKTAVIKLLKNIDENLEQDIILAEGYLEKLIPYLQVKEYKEFVDKLQDAVSNFETDEASSLIVDFIEELEDKE